MLTNEDFQKMFDVFATKQDLAELEQRMIDKMATKEDMNRVLNLVDQVLGEVKTMRIEQSAHSVRHDDIEDRVTNIEKIPVIAHQLSTEKN